MYYIITDIEWNGAFSKKACGYFNEIIEIGAVMLDERLEQVDTFHALIRPVISKQLSEIVTNMSSIRPEELKDGLTFAGAVSAFKRWIGRRQFVFLSWSTTDLLVWIENCRYFFRNRRLPFLRYFMDAQAYCQHRLRRPPGQQLGLGLACDMLGIAFEDIHLHRALDDALLTAQVFRRLFNPETAAAAILKADEAFYDRFTFKVRYISELSDPMIDPVELEFRCMNCGEWLERAGDWRLRSRQFNAAFVCSHCDKVFNGKVRFKITYDGLMVRRRLDESIREEEPSDEDKDEKSEETELEILE
ncbi:MAG: exonuclease domain-containing protein [Oscillospiraceae bacterium]|nr:exonuclease domain-containing protein [Oscillospiraceae bacterium]